MRAKASPWGNAVRCIPLRNGCSTLIDLSHDKGNYLLLRAKASPKRKALYGDCNLPIRFPHNYPLFTLHSIGWAGGHTHFISR